MTTRRLYHDDSELRTFEAGVVELRPGPDDTWDVVLDQTAFYPTGGGQPHDTGRLAGAAVIDVIEDGETIVHRLDRKPDGRTLAGEVDWERRLDHRQQHTGQHILSRAFVDLLGADTVGFHLGRDRSTIDLDREDLDENALARVEARANAVVLDDVPVTDAWHEDATGLPEGLRKEFTGGGPVRLVSIGDFDRNPCCGTHCRRSGQVGPVKILRTERKKGGLRVEFVCGARALRDYDRRHRTLRGLALAMTTDEQEIPARVEALQAELKQLRSRLADAESAVRESLLTRWRDDGGAGLLVGDAGTARADWLAPLAAAYEESGTRRFLFHSADGDSARVVFGVPEGDDAHAGNLLKTALAESGGRGGGSPRRAQGSVPLDALALLIDRLRSA